MLDLKSKLLAAGLVTKEQVERVEKQKSAPRQPKKEFSKAQALSFEEKERIRQREELKKLPKPEQYELIRKWVNRNRLDRATPIDADFEKFFFQGADGTVSWLTLEKSVHEKITQGSAGITAYMSNHGLAHCVMPRDIVEDIAEVFPAWLRVLKGHPTLQDDEAPPTSD